MSWLPENGCRVIAAAGHRLTTCAGAIAGKADGVGRRDPCLRGAVNPAGSTRMKGFGFAPCRDRCSQ
ncbi:hypothetical protein DESC_610251 [Desulfosarcina cetonica]|nr:hypothetical protein DESC_610251 [Desulfosarcina cetonica]